MSDSEIRNAIAEAVRNDHPCHDPGCYIAVALDGGFVYTAAWFLMGATETPALDALRPQLCRPGEKMPMDWADWAEWSKKYGHHCEACGGFTYGDFVECCADCGATVN